VNNPRYCGKISCAATAIPGRPVSSTGGGPAEERPTVTLAPPADPDQASAFLNLMVADIGAAYAHWSARGAEFRRRRCTRSGPGRWCRGMRRSGSHSEGRATAPHM